MYIYICIEQLSEKYQRRNLILLSLLNLDCIYVSYIYKFLYIFIAHYSAY